MSRSPHSVIARTVRRWIAILATAGACLFFLPAFSAFAGQTHRGQSSHGAQKTFPQPVSFLNDVEPILTHSGCNSGACHGSQFGKGGLKLSLAGYDPELDHDSLVKQGKGRRVSAAAPEASLLLKKPAMALPHKGGFVLDPRSPDYRTLQDWIGQGAPGPNLHDPHVTSLLVKPAAHRFKRNESRPLTVLARFNDGTERDVTAHTRIASLEDAIATVTPQGVVTARGPGATAIMLRYGGLAACARVTVPYRLLRPSPTVPGADSRVSFVDALTARRWRDMGLEPSGSCSDTEFIRRAYFDVIGTAPTPEEVRAFQAQKDRNKYAALIDGLLDRPEYADYWAVKWGDLLRNSRAVLGDKAMWSLSAWIRESLQQNRPYDAFVRDLLTAQGSAFTCGQANYYRVARTPQDLAETTAQLFLGVRLQCARCHHHPFEKWTQNDYYQFAAFFARVGTKESRENAPGGAELIVRLLAAGEVAHPKTGLRMAPTALSLDNSPRLMLHADPNTVEDRRAALAEWLTDRENLQFARTVVNRYWGYFLKRGIVDPVDDMRVTNPPSNPDLLEALARDFIAKGYNLKRLIRTICTSRVYRLSSRSIPQNQADEVFYSHFLPRRQSAEALLDAISYATGTEEKFPGLPLGTRAIQLPDATVASPFLDTFGRPPRSTACECERAAEPSLTQALQLLNGELVNRKITASEGRVTRMLASGRSDQAIIEELYYVTLTRPPGRAERDTALRAITSVANRRQGVEDLLWGLLNTKEFATIR